MNKGILISKIISVKRSHHSFVPHSPLGLVQYSGVTDRCPVASELGIGFKKEPAFRTYYYIYNSTCLRDLGILESQESP